MSVSALMASPLAAGLFQRAIGESGGLLEPLELAPQYRLQAAEAAGAAYAAGLGGRSLAELRRLPASAFTGPAGVALSHPVIEPRLLPLAPAEAYAQGRWNDVPLLVGSNGEEARSLTSTADVTAETYAAGVRARWGPLPPALYEGYPHATDAEARRARLDFERDLRFGWDSWTWARLQAVAGRSPVHAYRFTRRPPFAARSPYAGWGAAHFAELAYVFGHLGVLQIAQTREDRRLAARVAGYWTRFAATGDPNGAGAPAWPVFRDADGPMLMLGSRARSGATPDLAHLETFDAVYDQLRGGALRPTNAALRPALPAAPCMTAK